MDENSESLSVPEGALLEIANRILNLLDYPSELENEEDLFLDDFYIAIVGNLINDTKFDLKPGRDNEEKVQSLKKLLKLLQEIIEMDLSHINPEAIIYKHDRISTKSLLELIEELIKALINENEKEENEESDSIRKNKKIEEIEQEEISNSNLDSIQQKQNISDGNINKYNMNITDEDMRFNKEIIEDDDDDSIEDLSAKMQKIKESSQKKNNINNNNKNNIETPKEKKIEKKEEIKEEEEINKIESSSNKKISNQNKENDKNSNENSSHQSSLLFGNRSCFEPLDFEKALRDNIAHENGEDSYIRKTFTQNDILRYERELAENEAVNQLNENEDNLNYEINDKNLTDSHIMNVSNISGVSNSNKVNSSNKKKKNSDTNIPDLLDEEERKNTSSFIKKEQEKINNNNKNNKNQNYNNYYYEDDSNDDISNNIINEQSAHSVPNAPIRMKLTTTSDELVEASIDDLDNDNLKKSNVLQESSEQKNISMSNSNISNLSKSSKKSIHDNNINDIRKNTSSKKKVSEKKLKTNSSKNNITQSDISKSSIRTQSKRSQKSKNKKTENENDNNNNTSSKASSILEELPMDDEEIKYEIIKQFRRLYGNKLDRIFLKQNLQNSQNILEIILRNIKLARTKMLKLENRIPDPDDLLTKEFMHRYEKELQYILNYYKNMKKKRNLLQERALKSMSQNVRVMKKIQEIQTKKMENEIEKKRKAREFKNHQNQLRLCNEIYSKALQLEKERYLEELSSQMEIRRIENDEKSKSMMEIEKYYTDKIAILNEILKREKKDREIEHNAQIQLLSQIGRERKGEFRKQIDEVFQRFDEEDRKAEFEDNNQEQIEKILNNYYKK